MGSVKRVAQLFVSGRACNGLHRCSAAVVRREPSGAKRRTGQVAWFHDGKQLGSMQLVWKRLSRSKRSLSLSHHRPPPPPPPLPLFRRIETNLAIRTFQPHPRRIDSTYGIVARPADRVSCLFGAVRAPLVDSSRNFSRNCCVTGTHSAGGVGKFCETSPSIVTDQTCFAVLFEKTRSD